MLQIEVQRRLMLHDPARGAGEVHLSAASGLVCAGRLACVVADDELSLAVFDLGHDGPGRLVRLFDGELPTKPKARKAAKPDLEALLMLPALAGHAHGALLAFGSGSRSTRRRGALLPLAADGGLAPPARAIDLTPLLEPLEADFPKLNIEGALRVGDRLCLLQRANRGAPVNACISFAWDEVARWLGGGAAAPAARSITPYELDAIDGIPLGFTDGAALPDGGWVFCAAAEDTSDSVADGSCAGSVVGRVDAAGAIVSIERLAGTHKVEGIAVRPDGEPLSLLLVTDADDRDTPALLLSTRLR